MPEHCCPSIRLERGGLRAVTLWRGGGFGRCRDRVQGAETQRTQQTRRMKNHPRKPARWRAFATLAAALVSTAPAPAALKDGIVAYWPLDEVVGAKTPDLVSGYDMELANLTAADLVDGKRGKAFSFAFARQTLLKRVNAPGEQLPINQHPAFTITMWVNVAGTGQSDLRFFSEGSTTNNDPLFNLGTDNTGATGSVDIFLRRAGWTTVNHIKTEQTPLDGTWKHVTFVQSEDGTRALYFDGVKDSLEIPAKEAGDWGVNTTTIGGILRANPTHWVTGLIDDVALWNRALSPSEINQVVSDGLGSVFPPLAKNMVAYWPLDEVVGAKTPDLVNSYDMELANLSAADLVDGKRGKAFSFAFARQTLLKRVNAPGEQLPINQHPAFTLSIWANVAGTGQSDLRFFSEGSTTNNDPLFNLGTDSTGATGSVDVFLRRAGWTTVNHIKTEQTPLDGTWRHIVFVQGADGARALYFDGVKDSLEIPAKEAGDWGVNTTTIGGILRANPTHWVTGLLDDVALWSRALSPEEITSLFKDGTPVPFSKPQPLAIRSFTADLPASAVGGKVVLRWDVTKNVQVEIDQGLGDVTSKTVAGLGTTEVTISQSKTFKLTLRRNTETVSAVVSVAAIPDIAAGWTLVDNFDRYDAGNLSGKGGWFDLTATGFSIVDVDGNRMLAPNRADVGAVLPLRTLTVKEGQKATLFFRAYTRGDAAEALRGEIVLTDRRLRFGNEVNNGPGARLSDETDDLDRVGGANGYQGQLELMDPALDPLTAYNVWVDINNGPFQAEVTTGDTYSIHVQKASGGAKTTILADYAADRDPVGAIDTGATLPDLDSLAIIARASHSTTQNLLFDDLYLSQGGYLTTVPRAFGFSIPVSGAPPSLSVSRADGQVAITFGGGTLESAASATGPWSEVAGATSPFRANADGAQRFFRVKQ